MEGCDYDMQQPSSENDRKESPPSSKSSHSLKKTPSVTTSSRVFVGTSALLAPGHFVSAIRGIEKKLYNDQRSRHAYSIIAWQDYEETGVVKLFKYEILLVDLQLKSMETSIVELGSGKTTVDDLLKKWGEANPDDILTEVGTTYKSPEDAVNFIKLWNISHQKYNCAWDNCRTFVDNFVVAIVDDRAFWKARVSRARPRENIFAPVVGKACGTPLEYAHWRQKIIKNYATEKKKRTLFWRSPSITAHNSESTLQDSTPPALETQPDAYQMQMHDDGRIDVTINASVINSIEEEELLADASPIFEPSVCSEDRHVPPLNIVIQIVGSRGDVQPFLAIGQELIKRGHRVRLATHETFQKFVRDAGLEFYPLAGDPVELMAYMVKNPGLLPSLQSIKEGDISKKRRMIKEILDSAWDSCTKPDEESQVPFLADAIIANPPTFAHIHCAEKLCIPLHVMFTMPWSSTRSFPHPLINMVDYAKNSNQVLNLLSYDAIETLTWQGLGDIINKFRKRTLQLSGVPFTVGPYMVKDLGVPHTYCWSPNLIPKPQDWGSHINVSGFCFLNLASDYDPPASLQNFLESGPPPVYFGFGSIVVDDPDGLTKTIFDAIRQAGVRALVSKGWGGLGGDEITVPENVMIIENCPHDWLFPRCMAVCHHGGAGTTAAGLRTGRSTIIVPFFGDQPFWGKMTAEIGCGPPPIPFKQLNANNLAEAIRLAISPETMQKAEEVGGRIQAENGAEATVDAFHANLPLDDMLCDIEPTQLAALYAEDVHLKLCQAAADILLSQGKIKANKLRQYKPKHWYTEVLLEDLLSASLSAAWGLCNGFVNGTKSAFNESSKGIRNARGKPADQATKEVLLGVGKGLASSLGHSIKGGGKSLKSLGDGFRNTTALIDKSESVRPIPMIHGAGDGILKGFAELGKGVGEGFSDFFMKPIKGAMTEGLPGFGKGFAVGSVSMLTKPLAGCIDFVTLSSQGIYNSASDLISDEKRENPHGRKDVAVQLDREAVLLKFEAIMHDTTK